jgi:predicted nucleic acid-binding protein
LSVYADSSFFVSLYVMDRHSQEVKRRISKVPSLWLTPLHRTEWVHAIEQHVFRGQMPTSAARQVYEEFERDDRKGLWTNVELPEQIFETATQLARAHVSRIGTRTLDTLHVALALELSATEFWTFDERQMKLAKAAGLKTS